MQPASPLTFLESVLFVLFHMGYMHALFNELILCSYRRSPLVWVDTSVQWACGKVRVVFHVSKHVAGVGIVQGFGNETTCFLIVRASGLM